MAGLWVPGALPGRGRITREELLFDASVEVDEDWSGYDLLRVGWHFGHALEGIQRLHTQMHTYSCEVWIQTWLVSVRHAALMLFDQLSNAVMWKGLC